VKRVTSSTGGITILELMISLSLLGVLLAATFFIYTTGARAWAKGDSQSDLLRAAQIVSAKTTRYVESSTNLSLSVATDNSAVAFLSAENDDGMFLYDHVSLLPHWQKFIVLYHDPATKTVYFREVSVLGTTLETAPETIDALGGGPVDNYKSGGQPLGREIDVCRFTLTAESQLLTELESQKRHYGSDAPATQSTRFLNTLRN
jgi:Tfp pilus assembly protein PilE